MHTPVHTRRVRGKLSPVPGSIEKRGRGQYVVRVSLGFDPETGKRRMYNRTINGPRKMAEDHLAEVLGRKRQGTLSSSQRTLEAVLSEWLDTVKRYEVAEVTFASYVDLTTRYLPRRLLDRRIDSITRSDIQGLYAALQKAPDPKTQPKKGPRRTKPLGPKTIRLLNAILTGVFSWAAEDGLVGRKPTQGVRLPKKPRPRSSGALTEKQVRAFLKAAKPDRYGLLFEFALMTGLRPGELIGLRWHDVDFERAQVEVSQGVGARRGGGHRKTDLKTEGSWRTIPIGGALASRLRQHRAAQAEERLRAGDRWDDHDLVWTSRRGTPVSDKNLTNRHFKLILKQANLPPTVRLYDLRHTMATHLLASGENPKVVAERLGHKNITTTLQEYAAVLPGMQERATEKLEDLLRLP